MPNTLRYRPPSKNGSSILNVHSVRVDSLLSRNPLQRSQHSAIIALVTLHREATLLVSAAKDIKIKNNRQIVDPDFTDHTLWGDTDTNREIVSLGFPPPGVHLAIVDPRTCLRCSKGTIGEIWIAGPNITAGYLNSELNELVFNQRIRIEGDKAFFRTGDLGCLDDDGLFFLGRLRDTIVIRGVNHYPEDIEGTVRDCHADLAERICVAIALADEDESLAILLEVSGRAASKCPIYREAISEALSIRHGIRAEEIFFVPPKSLPQTLSGKIRRQDCRKMVRTGQIESLSLAIKAPSKKKTVEQTTVADNASTSIANFIVNEIRNVRNQGNLVITASNSLTQTGLDSVDILILRKTIEKRYGIPLSFEDLSGKLSVSNLALKIAEARLGTSTSEWAGHSIDLNFLSRDHMMQEQGRLWIIDQLNPLNSSLNLTVLMSLRGSLSIDQANIAAARVLQRHPMVRSTFQLRSGGICRTIHPETEPHLSVSFVPSTEEAFKAIYSNDLILAERRVGFDLTKGPLVRFAVVRFDETTSLVAITAHHIVCDLWSLRLLARDFATFCGQPDKGDIGPLTQSGSVLLTDSSVSRAVDSDITYWKRELGGVKTQSYVLSHEKGTPQSKPHICEDFTLSSELVAGLREVAQSGKSSVFVQLLSAVYLMMSALLEMEELVIAFPYFGREEVSELDAVGLFARPLLARIHFPAKSRLQELQNYIKTKIAAAVEHASPSLSELYKILGADDIRDGVWRVPLFVSFMTSKFGIDAGNIEASILRFDGGSQGTDVFIAIVESESGISGQIQYAENARRVESWREITQKFVRTVTDICNSWHSSKEEEPGRLLQLEPSPLEHEEYRVTIAATFSAEPIKATFDRWNERLDLGIIPRIVPVDQIIQVVLKESERPANADRGSTAIFLRLSDWITGASDREVYAADERIGLLINSLRRAEDNSAKHYFLFVTPSSRTGADERESEAFAREEKRLAENLSSLSNVSLVFQDELDRLYPVIDIYDAGADRIAALPYSEDYFAILGTVLARKIYQRFTSQYKVIVVDCDDTLWVGACGEIGPHGVGLTTERFWLQSFLLEQQKNGMLLCLASKNFPEDVFAVFSHGPEMPLKRSSFVATQINWERKSSSIRRLGGELNVSLDSFIMIDNDPVECLEVKTNCPEVLTICVPQEVAEIPKMFSHVWPLDLRQVAAVGGLRSEHYITEKMRKESREEAADVFSFIESLELKTSFTEIVGQQIQRSIELAARANQFHLSGRRLVAADLLKRNSSIALSVHASDRFGDYGDIGLLLCEENAGSLSVSEMILSCRALGRGIEQAVIEHLGLLARAASLSTVKFEYRETSRNGLVYETLREVGCDEISKSDRAIALAIPTHEACGCRVRRGKKPLTEAAGAERETSSPSRVKPEVSTGRENAFGQLDWNAIAASSMAPWRMDGVSGSPNRGKQSTASFSMTTEDIVARIWEEVLGEHEIPRNSGFFSVGGDSIMAVRILARVNDAFGVEYPIAQFFSVEPTIHRIAEQITDLLNPRVQEDGASF